ncbi:Gfo/Idh/MocA family oxidoreductase [Nonomuraea sp. NPDC050404]|uniref:Gfo/Idh/MocA family protein n=1 Tax=Nonomuraea sp. NPDC050404 TaxID=3155783 RepID=UPI0033FF8C6A
MPTNEPPFRLGLIGTGIVGDLHLRAARNLPHVTVGAVCDIRADTARRVAGEAGATAYTSHTEMLARERLDGVIITSPHNLHAEMTMEAAAAGVHVLVEKPMATTVADCTAMIEACAAAGVRLAVGHVLRFGARAREAEALLATQELGPVRAISHRRTAHYGRGSRPDWFFDPVVAGGGIVMNVGTHGLDRIQWLGAGMIESVHAHLWKRGGLDIETDAIGVVDLSSGVKASFLFTSAELPYTDETVVICERGSLRWSATEGTFVSAAGAERQIAPGGEHPEAAFTAQLADFADACTTGRPPLVGGDYGRSVVAAVLAIYESAGSGRPEPVGSALLRSTA